MPYFSGSANQITEYSQTLEDVQCIIDNNDPSPIIFLGDMNASLPQNSKLCRNWHRQHHFNNNSLLLYDFICQNDLYSCNLYYNQQIDYTYHRNNSVSYIDHVFCSRYIPNILNCTILANTDEISNHLPLQTQFILRFNNTVFTSDNCIKLNNQFTTLHSAHHRTSS